MWRGRDFLFFMFIIVPAFFLVSCFPAEADYTGIYEQSLSILINSPSDLSFAPSNFNVSGEVKTGKHSLSGVYFSVGESNDFELVADTTGLPYYSSADWTFQVTNATETVTFNVYAKDSSGEMTGVETRRVNIGQSETEDNGHQSNANPLNDSRRIFGYLSPGDADYYIITNESTQMYSIYTDYSPEGGPADTVLTVYSNLYSEPVATDDDSGTDLFSKIEMTLSYDYYYIKVSGKTSNANGYYKLRIEETDD